MSLYSDFYYMVLCYCFFFFPALSIHFEPSLSSQLLGYGMVLTKPTTPKKMELS